MAPKTLACSGDVTALAVVECGSDPSRAFSSVILAGIGSQVHAFALPGGGRLLSQAVLPYGIRVHGISTCRTHPCSGSDGARDAWIVAVHGDRHVALFTFTLLGSEVGAETIRLRPLRPLPRLAHWTMAVHLSPGVEYGGALLAVGLSNNSLEVYAVDPSGGPHRLLGRRQSAEQCLLYSMHLHRLQPAEAGEVEAASSDTVAPRAGSSAAQYLVAGGTVFLDVVIWAAEVSTEAASRPAPPTPASNGCRPAAANEAATGLAPLLYRLKGHDGSIHNVRWGADATVLASCSDDRTLRIWDVPQPYRSSAAAGASNGRAAGCADAGAGGAEPLHPPQPGQRDNVVRELQPRHVLYGHTARLWGTAFAGAAAVVSASEDCTCRVWDLQSGACLAHIQVIEGEMGSKRPLQPLTEGSSKLLSSVMCMQCPTGAPGVSHVVLLCGCEGKRLLTAWKPLP